MSVIIVAIHVDQTHESHHIPCVGCIHFNVCVSGTPLCPRMEEPVKEDN